MRRFASNISLHTGNRPRKIEKVEAAEIKFGFLLHAGKRKLLKPNYMRNNYPGGLEKAANIAIIIAALILGYFFIEKYFAGEKLAKAPPEIPKGKKVSIPELDWQADQKSMVLFLRRDCGFCTQSMPFYKRLAEKAGEKGVRVVAVLPDSSEEGAKYLKENGLDIREVRQFEPGMIDVRASPTLILTNGRGEAMNSWIGKLSFEKENEVIASL